MNLRVVTRNANNAYDNALRIDVAHASTTLETHAANWRYTTTALTIEQPSTSSSASLLVGNGWRVALRSQDGAVLEDPVIVGTYADREVFVLAHTIFPSVYLVRRGGGVRELTRLTDTQHVVGTSGEGVWIVDQEQLAGIGEDATGPSSLWYASIAEPLRPVATSTQTITRAIGTPTMAAWMMATDTYMTVRTQTTALEIPGTPIAWFGDTLVLYARTLQGFLMSTWNERAGLQSFWTTKDEPVAVELLD